MRRWHWMEGGAGHAGQISIKLAITALTTPATTWETIRPTAVAVLFG
jgi:hypothetical protein